MDFLDLTGELLSKVDFERSKIIQPRKLVFVCGGKASGNSTAATSMREVLLAESNKAGKHGQLGDAKVILAETAVDYLSESNFTNLLDLECYIAAVVHAVVLIVESPGSICELGAFVMTPEIREKLIIVMQSKYMHRSSFVTSGAIKFFKEKKIGAMVLGYDWTIDDGTRIITVRDSVVGDMLTSLPVEMDAVHKMHAKEKFKNELDGHLIFLTLAFCHIIRAAKISDIKRCFVFAEIEVSEKRIRQFVDVLVICELIKPISQGKLTFYVAVIEQSPLEIAFRKGTKKADRNTARWITRIVEKIRCDNSEKFRIDMFKDARDE